MIDGCGERQIRFLFVALLCHTQSLDTAQVNVCFSRPLQHDDDHRRAAFSKVLRLDPAFPPALCQELNLWPGTPKFQPLLSAFERGFPYAGFRSALHCTVCE